MKRKGEEESRKRERREDGRWNRRDADFGGWVKGVIKEEGREEGCEGEG